jgi:hypothetical protein
MMARSLGAEALDYNVCNAACLPSHAFRAWLGPPDASPWAMSTHLQRLKNGAGSRLERAHKKARVKTRASR